MLIARTIWLKALLYHSNTHDCVTKEPLQAAYRIIPQVNPPGAIHPPIIHIGILDSLRNRSRDRINDLYCHREPVPFWDRHPWQWASPPPPPRFAAAGFNCSVADLPNLQSVLAFPKRHSLATFAQAAGGGGIQNNVM